MTDSTERRLAALERSSGLQRQRVNALQRFGRLQRDWFPFWCGVVVTLAVSLAVFWLTFTFH